MIVCIEKNFMHAIIISLENIFRENLHVTALLIDKENEELFQIVQGALNLQMETKRKFKSVAHPYFPNMECADHYLDGGV